MLSSIFNFFKGLSDLIIDTFDSIIMLFGLLFQSMAYLSSLFYIVPGELLIFGIAFFTIFILNRLTFGSNGGDSK